jgi:anaerobic selenocysteine-containing dehydrogenase
MLVQPCGAGGASGWPDAETVLRARWIDAYDASADKRFADGFPTADRRFHFAPDWAALGPLHACMPKLPDHMETIDVASAAQPFRLVTAPARSFLNTSFTEMPSSRQREGRPTVLMHPADADRLGIIEGARVRLGNTRGEVVLHARLVGGMQPGVLVAESIWPSECFEGGIGINALTSDDPGPPGGGAVFHDTAVWLRAAAAALPIAAE